MGETGLVILKQVTAMCVLLDTLEANAIRDVVKIVTQAIFVIKAPDSVKAVKLVCMDQSVLNTVTVIVGIQHVQAIGRVRLGVKMGGLVHSVIINVVSLFLTASNVIQKSHKTMFPFVGNAPIDGICQELIV